MNIISPLARIYGTVTIGENVRIDDFCILTGNITIGNNVHIACFTFLSGASGFIAIGDYVGIGSRTTILTACDDFSGKSMNNPTIPDEYKPGLHQGPVVLCKHVIVGAHTVILPGVTIHEGCSVGAFGLVKQDLEAWGVYAGVPAKRIGDRARDLLELARRYEAT